MRSATVGRGPKSSDTRQISSRGNLRCAWGVVRDFRHCSHLGERVSAADFSGYPKFCKHGNTAVEFSFRRKQSCGIELLQSISRQR